MFNLELLTGTERTYTVTKGQDQIIAVGGLIQENPEDITILGDHVSMGANGCKGSFISNPKMFSTSQAAARHILARHRAELAPEGIVVVWSAAYVSGNSSKLPHIAYKYKIV